MLKDPRHPCKGLNCTDPNQHSLECEVQHAAAIAGGNFVPLIALATEVRADGEALMNAAERHRVSHEPHSVSPKHVDGIVDYALAGIWISTGMQHLDESLPNGQRLRSRAALKLILQGAVAMEVWMRAVGHIEPGEKL